MAASHLTADSSVVVPSLLEWHALWNRATAAVAAVKCLPAHVLAESFSVLTRLPALYGLHPDPVVQALIDSFPEPPLILSPSGYVTMLRRLADAGIGGGRVYDGIIAATAAEAHVRLLTADRRALTTYALLGAEFEFIG